MYPVILTILSITSKVKVEREESKSKQRLKINSLLLVVINVKKYADTMFIWN